MLTTRSLCKNTLQRHLPSLKGRHAAATPTVLTRRSIHGTTTNLTASIPHFASEFQAKNIYTDRFPCTLHYYSSRGPKLLLYDHREYDGDSDVHRLPQDAVAVNDQAIVDPAITSPWGGATMYPNTLLMLQITRSFSDWAEECKSKGEDVATPWFFTIPKGEHRSIAYYYQAACFRLDEQRADNNFHNGGCGIAGTSLPSHLFLVHEDLETFHLLPREAKPLHGKSHTLSHSSPLQHNKTYSLHVTP